MPITILDVGQCGFDGPRMTRLFREVLDATVDNAATGEAAVRRLQDGEYDIVLVNRIFAADGASGIDFIGELVKAGCTTPLMLVSDLPEAQDQAVAEGAVRGFGKAVLDRPETLELIRKVASGHAANE